MLAPILFYFGFSNISTRVKIFIFFESLKKHYLEKRQTLKIPTEFFFRSRKLFSERPETGRRRSLRLRQAVRLPVGHLALDGRVARGRQAAGRVQSGHLHLPVAPQRQEGLGILPGDRPAKPNYVG